MTEYSIALEKQLELYRYWNERGHLLLDATVNRDLNRLLNNPALTQKLVRESLQGETYYWAPRLCRFIEGTADSMPDWTFLDPMLPKAGFFWFSKPLALPPWSGRDVPLRAISWSPIIDDGGRDVFFWCRLSEEYACELTSAFTWFNGESRNAVFEKAGESRIMVNTTEPIPDDQYHESDEIDAAKLRVFSACVAFIEQRVFLPVRRRPDRPTRRRAASTIDDKVINVIELRRRQSEQNTAHDEVAWSCQWLVRGHWRQQWYPKTARHQPRWIAPYVKGPEDKPLKPPKATVFAVVR